MPAGPFTNDLSKANRDNGLYLLSVYYKASDLPKDLTKNFAALTEFLDKRYPSFIESLGEQLKSIPLDKMISAMRALGKTAPDYFPNPGKFAEQISAYGVPSFFDTASEAASGVASDIANFSLAGLTGILVISGIALFLSVYLNSGGKIKLPKLK